MKKAFILLFCFLVISGANAQNKNRQPLSADAILNKAYAKALNENKNVFLMFHASWCLWCHVMDTAMNDISCRKFFIDNYVIAHLDIMERGKYKKLENPGAYKLFKKYNKGFEQLPFWLVFDKDGQLLSDSYMSNGENIGCPGSKEEIEAFVQILKKTSKLKDNELEIIATRFKKNAN